MLTVAEKAMKLNDWKYSAGNTMNISDFCIAAVYHSWAMNDSCDVCTAFAEVFEAHKNIG